MKKFALALAAISMLAVPAFAGSGARCGENCGGANKAKCCCGETCKCEKCTCKGADGKCCGESCPCKKK